MGAMIAVGMGWASAAGAPRASAADVAKGQNLFHVLMISPCASTRHERGVYAADARRPQ